MSNNHNSVVVLPIRLNFWWMVPMGVKYIHTTFEQETQRWRPGTGFASGGPELQKLQFRAKNSDFWAKKALEHIRKRPNEGKLWVHSTCGLTSPCQRALSSPPTP